MKLHNYFRSSASFRVRIALELKGLPYEYLSVHLPKGAQNAPEFVALSPDHLVPVLEDGANKLTQSMAIIEYLDETHPSPRSCQPTRSAARGCVRSRSPSPAKSTL